MLLRAGGGGKSRKLAYVLATLSANQAIPNNTITSILWDVNIEDAYGLHNLTTPQSFTIPTWAKYLRVSADIDWDLAVESLPSNIVIGASPFTYQNTANLPVDVLVSGGTVSAIAFSRDNVTYYTVGTTGQFHLEPGDYLKITYTVAPTMTLVTQDSGIRNFFCEYDAINDPGLNAEALIILKSSPIYGLAGHLRGAWFPLLAGKTQLRLRCQQTSGAALNIISPSANTNVLIEFVDKLT